MRGISYCFQIILIIKLNFVLCEIPDLTVKRLDENVVNRKRNDTLELCRIYNQYDASKYRSLHEVGPNRFKRSMQYSANATDQGFQWIPKLVPGLINIIKGDKLSLDDNEEFNSIDTKIPDQIGIKKDFAPKVLIISQTTLSPDDDDDNPERIKWQKQWKHGIVPYYIDSKTYDSYLSESIIKAFDYFEKATCIRLQRLRVRPTDKASLQNVEWLYITNPTGIRQCVHTNENKVNSGVQMVVFGYDCMTLGEILHEVMHVLGFSHEHVRPDRDKYVHILWNNIKPGYKKYFMPKSEDLLSHLPYDYDSVMHYPSRAFSKNGQLTIVPETFVKIGQRKGLSETDSEKVNYIYSAECLKRNKEYLRTTCPTVIGPPEQPTKKPSPEDIKAYFEKRIWEYGIVSYAFKDNMEFSIEEKENIKAVIRHIEKETCIRFRSADDEKVKSQEGEQYDEVEIPLKYSNENKNETDSSADKGNGGTTARQVEFSTLENIDQEVPIERYKNGVQTKKHFWKSGRRHANSIIMLSRGDEPGCKCPKPGKPDGNQILNITADCFNTVNDLLHLFVHVLGLEHQHNSFDRDRFIHINWDQLSPESAADMQSTLPPEASLGYKYDYQSVMAYPWLEIKNGVANTMYPIWNDGWVMGHWQGLSMTDVSKLQDLYHNECAKRG